MPEWAWFLLGVWLGGPVIIGLEELSRRAGWRAAGRDALRAGLWPVALVVNEWRDWRARRRRMVIERKRGDDG